MLNHLQGVRKNEDNEATLYQVLILSLSQIRDLQQVHYRLCTGKCLWQYEATVAFSLIQTCAANWV